MEARREPRHRLSARREIVRATGTKPGFIGPVGASVRILKDKAIAGATSARTPAELETEIAVLDRLLIKAAAVKSSPTYAKWDALRDTLDDNDEMRDDTGARRKVIIFTEHKDTLDDLVARLTQHLGRDDAVITIHGGTKREDRKKAKETFEQNER